MTRPEEPSKYIWKWTPISTLCLGVGVLVFLLGLTGGLSVLWSIVIGVVVGLGGAIAFGFVPRNPPKPGIHGPGSMPGRPGRGDGRNSGGK
ncbi:hypothetical protein [Dietzia sp.]|uniref:hypothetical protein n=1 Tax=Dietzia sp. TaxID=1871616 RepID=UPI002FDAD036